jgi:hypothetical protein
LTTEIRNVIEEIKTVNIKNLNSFFINFLFYLKYKKKTKVNWKTDDIFQKYLIRFIKKHSGRVEYQDICKIFLILIYNNYFSISY